PPRPAERRRPGGERMRARPFCAALGLLLAATAATAQTPAPASKPAQEPPFSLPDRIREFPKADPAAAFAAAKIVDASGKPWRAASEDWASARQRAEAEPSWQAWVRERRASVDDWMARRADRTTWVCGWWHDFVSPKDGSFVTWTDQIPGEEVPFLHSPSDPRIEITPKLMGGWVFVFRGRHADKMLEAARLYRLTGEEKYAAWAAGQLDFYADHYAAWPPSVRDGSRLYWQTLDEATNLVKYAQCARLLSGYAAPERRAAWRDRFLFPEALFLNGKMRVIHNIATWHRSAAAQVALAFPDDPRSAALWKEAVDGEFGIRRQLACGVTSDYLWWEQSLGYNNYLVQALLPLFVEAGIAGRAPELAREMEIAEDLMLAPAATLRFPGGRLPTPADTTGTLAAPDAKFYAQAARVFPTPLGLETVAKTGSRTWEALLDPLPAPPKGAASAPPPVASRNLDSSRMAVVVSGPWQVFFHYGQLVRSHAQAEALNYEATFRGLDVTHDPGTVGYGSPLHMGYYRRGANHNVPLVDGEGQDTIPLEGVLDGFAESEIAASQPDYRKEITASRRLRIDGETLVDTVKVKAKDGRIRKLGLPLHLQGTVKPDGFEPDPGFAASRAAPFGYWKDAAKTACRDRAAFDVALKDQDGKETQETLLRVTIALPGPFTVWHASSPDAPPRRREVLYVETAASEAVFTTTIGPVPVAAP
ncbi:MAG TPA: heparinase II/III family protein, partial [Candidatus Methylacidiphilales bacterium]